MNFDGFGDRVGDQNQLGQRAGWIGADGASGFGAVGQLYVIVFCAVDINRTVSINNI